MADQKQLLIQAAELYKKGHIVESEKLCTTLLASNPALSDAHTILGLISQKKKEFTKSIDHFRQALRISGNYPHLLNNLGNSLHLAGKTEEAIKVLQKAITQDTRYSKAYFTLGKIYKSQKRYEEAIQAFHKTLELEASNIPALNNLANVYQELSRNEEAEQIYKQIISSGKAPAETYCNLANLYLKQNMPEPAIPFIHDVITINPLYPVVDLLKVMLEKINGVARQEKVVSDLFKKFPQHPSVNYLAGVFLHSQGKLNDAISFYKKAIQIKNDIAEVWAQLGQAYLSAGFPKEAEKALTAALRHDAGHKDVWYSLAKVKEFEKDYPSALAIFKKLLDTFEGDNSRLYCENLILKMRIADWSAYEESMVELKAKINSYLTQESRSILFALSISYFDLEPELHFEVAKKYAKSLSASIEAEDVAKKEVQDSQNRKLRIGYLSADFRIHAVGIIIKDWFAAHNPETTEVFLYSIINNEDALNKHFKSSVKNFRNIFDLSHKEAAQRIKVDKIDILIDLGGYTTYSRSQILAYRPAPLQGHMLGYPDTMGADFVDFIIADETLIPPHLEKYYSENVLRLEHAFFSSKLSDKQIPFVRKDMNLPEDAFVFCCFNSYYKIEPQLWNDWMEILKATPGSVLWLSKESAVGMENLIREAGQRGVDSPRLIFAERREMEEYLSSYKCADLFLDSHHYSAGSTAVCALWGGLPMLTYAGANNASRMGASIAKAALPGHFVCSSRQEYIDKAIYFYHHKEELEQQKSRLISQRDNLPLFNVSRSIAELECLLRDLYFQTQEKGTLRSKFL